MSRICREYLGSLGSIFFVERMSLTCWLHNKNNRGLNLLSVRVVNTEVIMYVCMYVFVYISM